MDSSSNDYIKSSIRRIIDQAPHKGFPKLRRSNESAIFKNVTRNHKTYCLEVMKKNEYYRNKLMKLLNDSVKDNDNGAEDKNAETRPEPSSSPVNAKSGVLDSRYIANRYHAEQFIEVELLKNEKIVEKIKQLSREHYEFQSTMWKQREEIRNEYRNKARGIENPNGLKKLSSMNKSISARKRESIKDEMKQRLFDHEVQILQKQKQVAAETDEILKRLGVPFFNLDDALYYPDVENDKAFVLDLLARLTTDTTQRSS